MGNKLKQKNGFTLLEIIIVIIIIGVLAGLALPRFFKTVETTRATEALRILGNTRQAIERCFLISSTYIPCGANDFSGLDIDNANADPQRHWDYAFSNLSATTYLITATRNGFDNPGNAAVGTIDINELGQKVGTGNYVNIR